MVRGGPFFGEKMGIKKGFTIINWNGRGGKLVELTGVIAKGIPRGCQGLFTPMSLGYPLSVFNKNSTLKVLLKKLISPVRIPDWSESCVSKL